MRILRCPDRRSARRRTLTIAVAVFVAAAIPTLAGAGHQPSGVASYTGCLTPPSLGGVVYNLKAGDGPATCKSGHTQIHLSGGDISAVAAGTGLDGGATNGSTTLTLQPSYRLPQSCGNAQVAKWDGTAWACANDESGTGTADSWKLTGNAGTSAGTNFLGTTDIQPLELKVNGTRALRIEPGSVAPNLIGGSPNNIVTPGVVAATIAGGGGFSPLSGNSVSGAFGTIGGGHTNSVTAPRATIAGGSHHTASGLAAAVGGGFGNTASGNGATVAGGDINTASAEGATVSGGSGNSALAPGASVGGGTSNNAVASLATVSGGESNRAAGFGATVAGGSSNNADAVLSFAAGRRAKIASTHDGAFVYADSTNADFASAAPNEFAVRASGGVRFVDASGTGVQLAAGGSSWSSLSARSAKANFATVDGRSVLERLVGIPVETWNYKSQSASIRHIGPMAQDFYAAFGVGESKRHISTVDADGVAFAAIQGLYAFVQGQEKQLRALRKQNASLAARIGRLERASATGAGQGRSLGFGHPGAWALAGVLVAGFVALRYRRSGG